MRIYIVVARQPVVYTATQLAFCFQLGGTQPHQDVARSSEAKDLPLAAEGFLANENADNLTESII